MIIGKFVAQLNEWGAHRIPFLFIIDYELKKPVAFRLDELSREVVLYDFNGKGNSGHGDTGSIKSPFITVAEPPEFVSYERKFNAVKNSILYGDSFLANLTIKTRINLKVPLQTLFTVCQAKYRLCYRNEFLVFSPETFVQIDQHEIRSFPMKGTIDAGIENAEEIILNDAKEMAEHVTIVDLIRNDLSQIASDVRLKRFRYVDHLHTDNRHLLQVSSEVAGDPGKNWEARIGDILIALLPAGSVSGAPKSKTVEILRNAEGEPRGYYTGVMGIFDGNQLDSGVMIRYIEQKGGNFYYRSGGGITAQSNADAEYREAINKVYVPIG